MKWHIALGTVAAIVLVSVLAYIAINESKSVRTVQQLVDDVNRVQQVMDDVQRRKSQRI